MGCTSSSTAAESPRSAPSHPSTPRPSAASKPKTFAQAWRMLDIQLGKGQYGTVYQAEERLPKMGSAPRPAAVKVMEKRRLSPQDLAALSVEIQAMTILNKHENFVKLYEHYDEGERFYLVLELITGGELFERIVEKEKYTEREARSVIRQLADAVAFAHSVGVAHRDLKPENILMRSKTDDTTIKIADMGFARVLEDKTMLMTTPCGTPGYVAPEVISGHPYTMQADVWSMGVIFFILLCGYPPFVHDDQKVLFELIKAGRYTFDPTEWAYISDSAKDLIRRILVVDPTKRLTAKQVLQHPWMTADTSAIPDVALPGTLVQLKAFNARRRLKKAINGVRSTVRMKILLAAKNEKDKQDAERKAMPTTGGGGEVVSIQNVLHKATKSA